MTEIQNERPIEERPSNYDQIVRKYQERQNKKADFVYKKYKDKMPSPPPTGHTQADILRFISSQLPSAPIEHTAIKNPNILTDASHPDIEYLKSQLRNELEKTQDVQRRFFPSGNNNG